MLKQIKDINELVLMWDLDENLRNEKLSTLMKWKEDLDEEEFEIVLKICNYFNYYSEKNQRMCIRVFLKRRYVLWRVLMYLLKNLCLCH